MGYYTHFKGSLSFTDGVRAKDISLLQKYLGEDMRDHEDWENNFGGTYINYKLTDDLSGLEWDESDKSYDMVEKLNFVINEIRKVNSEFSLKGKLIAKGEDPKDRWELVMVDGLAKRVELAVNNLYKCPCCDEYIHIKKVGNTFILSEEDDDEDDE